MKVVRGIGVRCGCSGTRCGYRQAREMLFVVARVATVKAWVSRGIPRLLKETFTSHTFSYHSRL
jgi:hypothetical protein